MIDLSQMSMDDKMDMLLQMVKELSEDNTWIKQELHTVKEDVSNLKEDVSYLKEDVAQLKEGNQSLHNKTDRINTG